MYCPTRTTVATYTIIRRERRMPDWPNLQDWTNLKGIGEQVEPADIVARGVRPQRSSVIDVARALSVPNQQAEQYIQVEVGSTVRAGETIAAKKGAIGILSKTCRAPFDGLVVAVIQGKVLLQPSPLAGGTAGGTETAEQIELPALLRGRIHGVTPERGVVIESEAGLVQGIWGWGGQSAGILKVLVDSPDEPLTTASIDATSQGHILVGGILSDQAALLRAAEVKVSGIVVGSIRARLAQSKPPQIPVVITEGFGQAPMSDLIFGLLKSYEREIAYISGPIQERLCLGRGDSGGPCPPEIAIFPTARGRVTPIEESTVVKKGAIVRITREPYLGKIGTVKTLGEKRQTMESGLLAQCAEIELGEQQHAWVPLANLERIQ